MRRAGLLFAMSWMAVTAGAQARPAIAPPPVSQTGSAAGDTGTASAFPATATASPQSVVSPDSYIIGPGDQLQVNVWNDAKLSGGALPVRPDGRISLPLLGDVPALRWQIVLRTIPRDGSILRASFLEERPMMIAQPMTHLRDVQGVSTYRL